MTAGRFLLALSLLGSAAHGAAAQLGGENTQRVTLLSQVKHNEPLKALTRIEPPTPKKRGAGDSNHTLRFGGMSLDGDGDWIDIPHAHGSRSQIKDLGALDWSEVFDVPFLHASPSPHPGGMTLGYSGGKVHLTPENVFVKAAVGHLYLVHFKDDDADFYLMFRVESLKSNDECTISWKYVPSPEP